LDETNKKLGDSSLAYTLGITKDAADALIQMPSKKRRVSRQAQQEAKKRYNEEIGVLEVRLRDLQAELKALSKLNEHNKSLLKKLTADAELEGANPSNETKEQLVVTYQVNVSETERKGLLKALVDRASNFMGVTSITLGGISAVIPALEDHEPAVDRARDQVDVAKDAVRAKKKRGVEVDDEDEDEEEE